MTSSSANSSQPKRHRIGIISISVIPDDPRVRRQGDLLMSAGWEVVAIGLAGARSSPPSWRCLEVTVGGASIEYASGNHAKSRLHDEIERAKASRGFETVKALLRLARKALILAIRDPVVAVLALKAMSLCVLRRIFGGRVRRLLQLSRIFVEPASAERLYWVLNNRFRSFYHLAAAETVDLWLANDWTALPVVRKIAAEQGIPFAYDTHELAIDEYAHRWGWRLLQRPLIAAIERAGICKAAFVSCVSESISRRLAKFYNLDVPPLVIRSTPIYQAVEFRPTQNKISVLYQGIISPGRGLEACIESVKYWRPEFSLTIRGPGSDHYIQGLVQKTHTLGIVDRVLFVDAVPMIELVQAAAGHDVGLFALPGHSLQNVYALPNKFFEYMMAGLALCISDLPEMAQLLRAHDLGTLIPAVTPRVIAKAINGLDRLSIDRYKRNSLKAAQVFNWENEGHQLLRACGCAVRIPSSIV